MQPECLIFMVLVYMWPYVAAHIKAIALIPWHEVKKKIPQSLNNVLAVDLFSYTGLHDTEQIIFWWVRSLAVLTHFLPLI